MRAKAYVVIDGITYQWAGWFGCQLESLEWRRVPAGTERNILGHSMRVFTTRREGLKIRTTWTIPLHCGVDEANKRIRNFRKELRELI